jgi:hypothetical protein
MANAEQGRSPTVFRPISSLGKDYIVTLRNGAMVAFSKSSKSIICCQIHKVSSVTMLTESSGPWLPVTAICTPPLIHAATTPPATQMPNAEAPTILVSISKWKIHPHGLWPITDTVVRPDPMALTWTQLFGVAHEDVEHPPTEERTL